MTFYPRRKRADVCDGADPSLMCSFRRAETMNGTFYYDARREGYYYTLLDGPWGIPVLLDACPLCKELLPGPEARRRWESKLEQPLLPRSEPIMGEMDVTDGGDS